MTGNAAFLSVTTNTMLQVVLSSHIYNLSGKIILLSKVLFLLTLCHSASIEAACHSFPHFLSLFPLLVLN